MSAELVLPLPNAVDIPASLRRIADAIEAGDHPELRFIVMVRVYEGARFQCAGYGKMSMLEALGALARALASDLVDV